MRKIALLAVVSLFGAAGLVWSDAGHDLLSMLHRPDSHAAADAAREKLAGSTDLEHAFELVAEALQPSVVAITSSRVVRMPEDGTHSPFQPFGERGGRGQDRELRERGLGSGVIVSRDGYILTNNHVVGGMDDLEVSLSDGRSLPAKLVGADPHTDVAVIKIDAKDLLPAPLGDSDAVKVGQWVAAFGAPFGLRQTMTSGIISAKSRARLGIVDYEDFLQTDAAINRGNSGGPLVNLKGEVIGINTAIFSQTGTSAGIGFAVPSKIARKIMDLLIQHGRVVRGFLGVLIQDLTADSAKALGIDATRGVLVSEVNPGGPANRAGLEAGDVVLRLDGVDVTDVTSFRNKIAEMAPGTDVRLLVRREGSDQELVVRIGELDRDREQAAAEAPVARNASLGLALQDVTPAARRAYRLDDEVSGAVITGVEPGTPAEDAGLKAGDVLVGVGRTSVGSASEALRALTRSEGQRAVALRVRSGDTYRSIVLRR